MLYNIISESEHECRLVLEEIINYITDNKLNNDLFNYSKRRQFTSANSGSSDIPIIAESDTETPEYQNNIYKYRNLSNSSSSSEYLDSDEDNLNEINCVR
ncbi:unnamed protein product [Gordionus sp. m RMFG-2023]